MTPYLETINRQDTKNSCEAITKTDIIHFSKSDFDSILGDNNYLKILETKLLHYAYREKEKREHELLVYDAKERYRSFLNDHADITYLLTQKNIANYLGITPSSLSRLIGK